MRVGWSDGAGERVLPELGWTGLERALERRGAEIVPVQDPADGVDLAVLAAPSQRLGPERVRGWRRWADGGGRLLVLGVAGGDGPELTSDAGLTLPGMGLAPWHVTATLPAPEGIVDWAGSAFSLRNSAALQPPHEERAGRLWPRGRGWFRFGRSHDVLEAWPLPSEAEVVAADGVDVKVGGWAWLHLGFGDGAILGLADAGALHDEALSRRAHVWLLGHVLGSWLPAPEVRFCTARLAAPAMEPAEAEADVRHLVRALESRGLPLGEPGDVDAPLVARAPAFRALGDAGLVRWDGARIALTELGRARLDVVSAVFDARSAMHRADLADLNPD